MGRLFEDARAPYQRAQAGVFPLINLTEDGNNYYVRAELPGVKAGELDIQTTANNIAITGERKIAAEDQGARYHRREREADKFSRMIDLRDNTLTLSADIARVENANEEDMLVEYETGKYYRQFTIGELINQEKIDAKLNEGILRLKLPKVEKATPKKIVVKTA
jgi:HSP20 family molecular chaperone IbpA